MQMVTVGVATFLAALSITTTLGSAPVAMADSCDPAVTICQGDEVQPGNDQSNFSPTVSAVDDQYPNDGDWYFNPAGGGTALQPEHPSTGGGGARH